ncbi:unnamed protein product [Choristocarpus tenellus]
MRTTTALIALLAVCVPFSKAETVPILDCDDLEEAAQATADEDTTADVQPGVDLECETWTTFTVRSNKLTVTAPSTSSFGMRGVRFSVESGARLEFDHPNVQFDPPIFPDDEDEPALEVDGGILNVAEGGKVKFSGGVSMTDIIIRSVTDPGSDFTNDQWNGGCMFNKGDIYFGGFTDLEGCDSRGGGESNPGQGGAVWNGESGKIRFAGDLSIQGSSITDDEGNNGGAIYNLGMIVVEGEAVFEDNAAASGGAIYNGEDGMIDFREESVVSFINNRVDDGAGGAILNLGKMMFSGPSLFYANDASFLGGAIANLGEGRMRLSSPAVFWRNTGALRAPAVFNSEDARLDIPKTASFVGHVECNGVFFEEGEGGECKEF